MGGHQLVTRIPLYLDLPDVIEIQSKPDDATTGGGWENRWPTFAEHVRAEVIPTNAEEVIIGDRPQAEIVYSIIIPAKVKGLLSSMRIIWKTRELYITAIMPEIAENGVQIVTARERQYDPEMT
jgi:head-tail adaptor